MNEKHNQDFWENIVKIVEDNGTKLSVVLDQYQITRSSYYYWRKRLHRSKEEIEEDEQTRKNKQLQKENLELRMENEILKKQFRLSGKSNYC